MKVYKNLSQVVTLKPAFLQDGRFLKPEHLGLIENGAVAFDDESILWVGDSKDLPKKYLSFKQCDLSGHTLTPEIVDSHTHLVFGGDRAAEYTMRLNGADYIEIANSGGGILNTMSGTNSLNRDELFLSACERIERIYSYGVGTIEIKSGYGLNFEKEFECSHIINDLKNKYAPQIQIINTYMAAHAVPKKYSSSTEYLNNVVIPLLEKLAPEKILDAVDIFHEDGYFSVEDVEALFNRAKALNINIKSHADEFADGKGAILAAKHGALSTDHLLCTGNDGIKALSSGHTVATLLPGTGFFLGKPQSDARKFWDAGCKVAIASDYNPGSCHCDNVILVASLAAPHYKANICELWAAITLNAAHALGLRDQGAIVEKMLPRFSLFNTKSIDYVTYNWGRNFSVSLP